MGRVLRVQDALVSSVGDRRAAYVALGQRVLDVTVKVLHVIPTLRRSDGGPSHALVRTAAALAQAGLSVDIATTTSDRDDPKDLLQPPDGVEVRSFPRWDRFYRISLPLARWLKANVERYDLVHTHALFSHAPIAAGRACIRSRVPYVVRPLGTLSPYSLDENHPLLKRIGLATFERRVIEGAAMLHFTTEFELRESGRLGLSPPTSVIPVGIDLDVPAPGTSLIERYPQLRDRTIVLFLSRIHPKKGLDLLIEAIARVRTRIPDVSLVIAGSGTSSHEADIEHQIKRSGTGDVVVRTGFVEGPDKAAVFAGTHIFVLPSLQENFGVAVAEAMLYGVPVVTTPEVALADEVVAADAGIVVTRNVDQIGSAIERLARDPLLREHLGSNGRRHATDHYSLEMTTKLTLEMYEKVLARS